MQYRKSQPASGLTKTQASSDFCVDGQNAQAQHESARKRTPIPEGPAIVSGKASLGRPSKGDFEAMARRRFQDPKPKRRGKWWTIQVRHDEFVEGHLQRTKTRVRIAPATVPEREARKIAAEYLRPQNQGWR